MKKKQKGTQIHAVKITGTLIEVIDKNGELIKVTRAQREAFRNYKKPDYIDEICKLFSNNNIIAYDFIVIKNGELVFHR